MTWTTFAALTAPTLPELDGNFNILSALANISVSIAGTNTLALTNTNTAGSITAYQQNMRFVGVASATNTGAVTAAFGSLAALNVYIDSQSGPVALSGGEIVQNCDVILTYDAALNSGAGGFHLITGSGALSTQTLNIKSLEINSGPAILGMPSTLATIAFTSVLPNSQQSATVTLSGIHTGDLALLTLGAAQTAGIVVQPSIPAAGTVVVTASNITSGTTVTPATAPYRLSVMRYS